ncbi:MULTISPECIES: hypothetical protein [unclassified Streptomyces]|uniref:hypothetical protein n=1 Tax=unclassified Streptomyces TaxID=2593676 RepID=UPI000F748307|nr:MULTISPECIES: hypothetical protein [unclassified Streptomyces]
MDRTAVLPRTDAAETDAERTTMLRSPFAKPGGKGPWPASSPADAAARDPWREEETPAEQPAEATHDPHEVTVQLDAVQFGDGVLSRAPARPDAAQDGSEGPVFVDESGRRSRRYRRIGMTIGLLCAGYAVVIVATLLSGTSDAPWLPVPGQEQEEKPAGKVETTPEPGQTEATPSSGTSLLPGGSASPGASNLPGPGAGVSSPGTTTGPDTPAGTTDPAPSKTPGRSEQPGGGTADDPTSKAPVETPTTPPATTPPADDDPDPETSAPAGGEAGGTEVNGAGANTDPDTGAQPVAAETAATSPEYVL